MNVTAANTDGLKRELKIVIGAAELGKRAADRLDELKNQVRLKGFRPGKVPVEHLRRLYGRSVMAEVLQESVNEANQKAIEERKERPAFQPDVKFTENNEEIEAVMAGKADLSYTVSFEVIPEITLADFSKIELERPVAEVTEAETDKGLESLVESAVSYKAEPGRAAVNGDQLTVDFVGKIDDKAFDGGTAEAVTVVLGRGGFIPGFEEGLTGAVAGTERQVKAKFPEAYQVAELAGKEATFDVKIKEVAVPERPAVDDELAKKFGAESLVKLRELIAARIRQEFDGVSRMKVKRALLDALEKSHTFELPARLVDNEFEMIWQQVTESLKQAGRTLADEGKTEDEAKAEYRRIAERRVRLGLVLSEIGEKNQIKVAEEEVRRALLNEARRYPGQERQVFEFYQKNPQAMAQLRAPLYEDKVVDFVLELARPKEKKVTREELLASDETADAALATTGGAGRDRFGRLPGDPHYGHDHGPEHDHAHGHHGHGHDHGHDHGHGKG